MRPDASTELRWWAEMAGELIILRHGRTEANAQGLLQGRIDPPLDDLGRRQASAAAAHIGPVDRVVSSPLLRARQTAEAFGLAVAVDDRFIELDYGDWEGRPVRDVPADQWAAWRASLDFRPPNGESLAELGARVRQGCEDLLSAVADGERIVVTAHVSPIKAAVAWSLGVGDEVTWRMFVAQAAITRISPGRGSTPMPQLIEFNRTAPVED